MAPMPWSREQLTPDPVTVQERVLVSPAVIGVGDAVKLAMTGFWTTVTVTEAVVVPTALVAVSV